jgi:hypothetical protein
MSSTWFRELDSNQPCEGQGLASYLLDDPGVGEGGFEPANLRIKSPLHYRCATHPSFLSARITGVFLVIGVVS